MSTRNETTISCTIKRADLLYLLDRAIGAIGKRYPYFLINVYLTRITCSATDLEIGVVAEITKQAADLIECGGTACVPAAKLREIIAALPAAEVSLKGLDNFRLEISSGDYHGIINGVDPEEHYPTTEVPDGPADVTIQGDIISKINAAVGHAISTKDDSALNGLYLCADEDRLIGVACDGHRISLAAGSIPYDDDCQPINNGIIINQRALGEIKKMSVGFAALRIRNNQISLEQSGATIIAQLLEGTYPAYRKVIPLKHPHCCVVSAKTFIGTIERVNILNVEAGISINIQESGQIAITCDGPTGTALDNLPCETEGGDLTTILTTRYLLDACKSLARDSEDIVIKYLDATSPVVLLPADHSNWNERIEVIMPRSAA